MKISAFLLFFTLLNISATNYAQNTKITLDLENVTLERVLNEIESVTDFKFLFNRNDIDISSIVSVEVKKVKVKHILNEIFLTIPATFEVLDKQIILLPKVEVNTEIESIESNIQQKEISGTVVDDQGEPLPGASILIKGTTSGTTTDFDGLFSLDVTDEATTLVVSFIGYVTQEVLVQANEEIRVQLVAAESALDEVVVVGYGTSTKEKFNGSVSKVDDKTINNYSSAGFEQALSGTMSGVQVLSDGKNPGDNAVIQIRGINTLTAGTNPLIVVDGNPLSAGASLSSVNNNDIASINVLKDAASASIYGSRASNGVILITTKKGRQGSLKVSYNGYVGVQSRADKFKVADAYDTALFDMDARNFGYLSGGTGRSITDNNATRDANGGGKRSRIQPFLQDYVDGKPGLTNTDWSDAVFRDALQQIIF